jgi:hypothetical protein
VRWLWLEKPQSTAACAIGVPPRNKVSARAGYATVLFPVVALAISTSLEGYSWSPIALAGAGLTILGNIIMFWRPGACPRHAARPADAGRPTRR